MPAQANTATPTPAPVILMVDDEPDILDSMQQLLSRSRLRPRVLTAGSGADGLRVLGRESVDLLVSDFKMPGMDGIQFLVEARRQRPEIPRVLFTAYADDGLKHRAETEAEVKAFLSKAQDPQAFVRTIEALLETAVAPGGRS